jgi:hypothetical protein
MGKSRRIHNRRVQKKHTRKHEHTRRKNKVKKKYSRKQRGGVATAAVLPFIEVGGALVLTAVASFLFGRSIRGVGVNRNTEYTTADLEDNLGEETNLGQETLEELIHSLSRVGENNNASDSLNVVFAFISSISNLLAKGINSVNHALEELNQSDPINQEEIDRITNYQDDILELIDITSSATTAAEAAEKALARAQTEIPKTIQKVKELHISNLQGRISYMEKQQQIEMDEAIKNALECQAHLKHLLETVNEITISDPFQSDDLKEDEIWSSDVTAEIIYKTNKAIESITEAIESLGNSRYKGNSRIVIL